MLLKIGLHLHSNHSDGTSRVEEILETTIGRGLDGIAITDHNTIASSVEASNSNTDLIAKIEVNSP